MPEESTETEETQPRRDDERPRRRPYARPVVQSGAAFERVQLQSGCTFFDPLDCDPPCG